MGEKSNFDYDELNIKCLKNIEIELFFNENGSPGLLTLMVDT